MQNYELFDVSVRSGPNGFTSVALGMLQPRRIIENLPLQFRRDISGVSPKRTRAFEKKQHCTCKLLWDMYVNHSDTCRH
jgi:hypothetical protein